MKSSKEMREEYMAALNRDPERKKRFDALVKDLETYIEKHYVPEEKEEN